MAGGKEEYYSFDRVLKELQVEAGDLKKLISEGDLRAFRDGENMKFKKMDVEDLKKTKMAEPTIMLNDEDESSESESEVLLVDENTSETLLDESESDNLKSSLDIEDPTSARHNSVDNDDSNSYVLENVREDTPKDKGDTFIDSDAGIQTEPLDNVEDSSGLQTEALDNVDIELEDTPTIKKAKRSPTYEEEDNKTKPIVENVVTPFINEPQISPLLVIFLIGATLVLLFGGLVVVHTMRNVDTNATGWLTDTTYNMFPAKHLYEKSGTLNNKKIENHMKVRQTWRDGKVK
jgi:hypothetical protein